MLLPRVHVLSTFGCLSGLHLIGQSPDFKTELAQVFRNVSDGLAQAIQEAVVDLAEYPDMI